MIRATYDPKSQTVTLQIPLTSILPPSTDEKGNVSKHAMLFSTGRAWNVLVDAPGIGPVRGAVNLGVRLDELTPEMADTLGVDADTVAAAMGGQTGRRRGGAVSITSAVQSAHSPTSPPGTAIHGAKLGQRPARS